MRKVLPIAFAILLGASVALASGLGRLAVCGDTDGLTCAINQPASGTFLVHLVHIESDGATGFQFSAPMPSCMTGTAMYLNDVNPFPVVLGNTQTGIAIAYGACKTGNFLICSMNFFSMGTTPPCCVYYIFPDPRLPENERDYAVADCDFIVHKGNVKAGVVNQTAACSCEAIATEETSWGKIKALYSGE